MSRTHVADFDSGKRSVPSPGRHRLRGMAGPRPFLRRLGADHAANPGGPRPREPRSSVVAGRNEWSIPPPSISTRCRTRINARPGADRGRRSSRGAGKNGSPKGAGRRAAFFRGLSVEETAEVVKPPAERDARLEALEGVAGVRAWQGRVQMISRAAQFIRTTNLPGGSARQLNTKRCPSCVSYR